MIKKNINKSFIKCNVKIKFKIIIRLLSFSTSFIENDSFGHKS